MAILEILMILFLIWKNTQQIIGIILIKTTVHVIQIVLQMESRFLSLKNNFFKLINNKNSQNWVDIENEYYKQLKTIVKLGSLNSIEKKEQIITLNTEFEQVKNLLEKYLKEKVLGVFNLDSYHDSAGEFFKFQKVITPVSINFN